MKVTTFYLTDRAKQPLVAEPFPNDRTIGNNVPMGDPRVVQKWESGGGGMVSTIGDYSRFAQGSVSEMSQSGAGGTTFWVNSKENMFVIFMAQTVSQRARIRIALKNVVYGAFEK
jgi:CubicO group peptidase (beta-lactamase class C family)